MFYEPEALWYKNAVIYSLDVETYMDSNGDGIGDFAGLTETLDYIRGLGANTIWLLPFYPTPNRDNGYDVTDYYSVDPRLGTLGDFVEFTHRAHDRGLRVIVDLVINHTSIDHPWFQQARRDKNSKYRDYYHWADEKPTDADKGMVFPGFQETTWTYDEVAGQYYYHRFYEHQADLNIANPDLQVEIRKIMGFWLALGVSGFRIDAAPFIIEFTQFTEVSEEQQETVLEFFRHFLSWRRGDAIMLAEANIAMDKLPLYFGDGDRMHMLFHFMANQHLFASLALENAEPLIEALKQTPEIPSLGQWTQFLRVHDELDLGRLDEDVRQKVYEVFAPEENMRIYDRGIRRRLAPMLGNDRRRIELANSLMLTLPGTPVIRYGQEIGMGDCLALPERNSVRTPMQWSREKNGGFSTAPKDQLPRPMIDEGEFSYERVNVADQRRDRNSLLHWMQNAVHVRQQCPEFGTGRLEMIETGEPSVFAHRCISPHGIVIALHNFSKEPVSISVELGEEGQHLIDLLSNVGNEPPHTDRHHVGLDGYGYRWFRLHDDAD